MLLQHYYVAIIFHHRVWYHALYVRYVRIRSSGIIPRLPLCQISFLSRPIAELARGEKSHTQLSSHPAYLMPRELNLALRNSESILKVTY